MQTAMKPWILLAAVSFAAASSWSQPCSAFEADGLYSGMSLEDFKKSQFLVGKRVVLFNDTPEYTSYLIGGHDRVEFCYRSLSLYSRNIKDPLVLSSLIKTALTSKATVKVQNKKYGSVRGDKINYETALTWVVDGNNYKLWFKSIQPVDIHDLQNEDAVSAVVSFGPYLPGELMSLAPECKQSHVD